jgi:hypothetical protein
LPEPTVDEVRRRLGLIFPDGVPDRARLTRELAARTIATFLFVGAVGDPDDEQVPLVRPSMVTWLDAESLSRIDDGDFVRGWHRAAARRQSDLREFLAARGIAWDRWYADNSRESVRDEVIRPLAERYGAVLRKRGAATSRSTPALTLAPDFAALFESGVSEHSLRERIARWQQAHVGPAEQARLAARRRIDADADAVVVNLPGRGDRHLPPGLSSTLTAEVIRTFAPLALRRPYTLAICHSRDPVATEDERELARVGLTLDRTLALPDVLLLDVDDGSIWFVEVVVTDGAIHDRRREELLGWAERRQVDSARCRFVTAYRSRSDSAFRRTVAELAWDSLAWFAEEPNRVFRLQELATRGAV